LLNELLNLRSRPSSVTVPNVTNIALTSAESVLHNAGLLDNTIYQPSLTIAAGQSFIRTLRLASRLRTALQSTSSSAAGAALVPNEIGRQIALALADVLALGLLPRVSQIPSFSAPPGTVVKQEPLPGDRVLIGSPVFFTVVIAPLPGAVRSLLPSTEDIVNVVTIIQS
jgi:beta-lactam-binding protein with PASTA domain